MKHMVIPVNRAGSTLIVAMADPSNIYAIDELKFLTSYNIEPVVAAEAAIEEAIERYYDKGPDLDELIEEFDERGRLRGRPRRRRLQRRRPREPGRRGAGRQAVQRHPAVGHQEEGVGHPRRALREGFRVRYRIDGVLHEEMRPPLKLQQRHHSPPQDHGEPRHRRAAPAPGRPHQAQDRQGPRDGLPRLVPARPCSARRSSSASSTSRNLQLDMTKLGFETKPARGLQGGHQPSPTAWCWSPGRPGRARRPRCTRRCPSSTRSTTNISTAEDPVEYNLARHQPGADARGHRPQLRRRPALVPAPGPRHHHGRRDSRLRDRRDRGQGRAHRPPGALDPAHQRRARRPSRACSTWASSRSW